ncbi:MAG: hypothetical protein AB8G05_27095 [Oligoflexales bacterium]
MYLTLQRENSPSLGLSNAGKAVATFTRVSSRRIPRKDIAKTFASPDFYTRLSKAKKTGLRVPGETSEAATKRFVQRMAEFKKTIPNDVDLDDAFRLWEYRANKLGVLDFNGRLRDLEVENPKISELYNYNFSKLKDFLDNPKLKPEDLWELQQRWPWPSDHLPASSIVQFSNGLAVKATSMNLLKKGFDDNRLQTSQGLGAQLASRYLKRVEGQRDFVLDFDKQFNLPMIRNDAQMKFIDQQITAGKIDLLGLQEVTQAQVGDLQQIGLRHNFEVIDTSSARQSRDVVTDNIDPELQDHGVIFVDKNKYDILDEPVTSTYGSGDKANKHITSVLLRDKETGKTFTFTNTHADFGRIVDLAEHQKNLITRWKSEEFRGQDFEGIIVGDMNAASGKVLGALSRSSPEKKVQFGENTPAHVGFSGEVPGEVVAYDSVFAVGNTADIRIKEDPDIGVTFREYAKDYRDSMANARNRLERTTPP